jgi:hypothetical protein
MFTSSCETVDNPKNSNKWQKSHYKGVVYDKESISKCIRQDRSS